MCRVVVVVAAIAFTLCCALSCAPGDQDEACAAADKCDNALEEPFGDFAKDDPTFGDGGTCWQNETTAKACIDECNAFLQETADEAQGLGEDAVVAACTP